MVERDNIEAAMQAGREAEERLFAQVKAELSGEEVPAPVEPAPAIEWPRTIAAATAFFQSGAGAAWFAELPEKMKTVDAWELLHTFKQFHENTRIAHNLETRLEELAALASEMHAHGFNAADLEAFERKGRGLSPFRFAPDYILPVGYKRTDEG